MSEEEIPESRKGLYIAIGLFVLVFGLFVVLQNVLRPDTQKGLAQLENQRQLALSESLVREVVGSEELVLELTPQLRQLAQSLRNLQLPDPDSRSMFGENVDVVGELGFATELRDSSLGRVTMPLVVEAQSSSFTRDNLSLWKSWLDRIEKVDHPEFSILRGTFPDDSRRQFDTVVEFRGLVKYRNGRSASCHADINIVWQRNQEPTDTQEWRITSWATNKFETLEFDRPLFSNLIDEAVVDKEVLSRTKTSKHLEIASALIEGQQVDRKQDDGYPYFYAEVTLEHPGLAVVDVDQDGFDDLFVAMTHGQNLLLRNKGDGTFEEVASRYDLDLIDGDSTSAIFADFDNDGDPDLFLGRARSRARYLVNESDHFADRTEELIDGVMPFMVSSISAADYNSDGLLDVYLCTFSPIENMIQFAKNALPFWAQLYLQPEEYFAFQNHMEKTHSFLDRPGPPNLLLTNIGGRFKVAQENQQLQLWRKSFQAAWCDFDDDGDPDVYVSNVFGPDNFFRNDMPNGFTDITEEAGVSRIGIGTGVAWNDFDHDGKTDLYVSNLYSLPGRRITDQFDEIDPRLKEMAEGNFLYRNDGQGFKLVSGSGENDVNVSRAGWSWGGQFFDVNNDGLQDIHVANGYYSAPTEVAVAVDLESNFWRAVVRSDENLDDSMRTTPAWNSDPVTGRQQTEVNRFAMTDLERGRLSLSGYMRNRLFMHEQGGTYSDISGVSGLDSILDGRASVIWDYDRDGYQDIALVNVNAPLLGLYRNQIANQGDNSLAAGNMFALRFVGGNREAKPTNEFSCRDGYGVTATIKLAEKTLKFEHRCGEGFAAQNSDYMLIGIGNQESVEQVEIRWPSGIIQKIENVSQGELITCYENAGETNDQTGFVRASYLADKSESNKTSNSD